MHFLPTSMSFALTFPCFVALIVILAFAPCGTDARKEDANSAPGAVEERAWQKWKVKNDKSYSPTEEPERRALWAAKYQQHKSLKKQKAYTKGITGAGGALVKPTGKHGPNGLADLKPEEFKKMAGYVPMTAEQKKAIRKHDLALGSDDTHGPVPDHVDWRDQNKVTPIKNQGVCSSCWAFAAAAVLESQRAIHSGVLEDLSPQDLMDCTPGWSGCEVGYFYSTAFERALSEGIQGWNPYPYTHAKNPQCPFVNSPNLIDGLMAGAHFHQVPEGDEEALKRIVAHIGPVAAAVKSESDSFRNYGTGEDVYNNEPICSQTMDHAITIVGYGTDESTGQDYWLIKNSWGTNWGDAGYMRLARNAGNYCGIATDAWYAVLENS